MDVMRILLAALLFLAPVAQAQEIDLMKLGRPLGGDDTTPMEDRFVYFNESTVSKDVPVTTPVLINSDIEEWLSQRIAEVMTLDGPGYEQRVTVNRRYFTATGYKDYVSNLVASQVPKLLKEQRYNMSAVVLQKPEILAQGLRENEDKSYVYVWQEEAPVTLVYQNLESSNNYKVRLKAEIVRIPMTEDNSLVALNRWQFVADDAK